MDIHVCTVENRWQMLHSLAIYDISFGTLMSRAINQIAVSYNVENIHDIRETESAIVTVHKWTASLLKELMRNLTLNKTIVIQMECSVVCAHCRTERGPHMHASLSLFEHPELIVPVVVARESIAKLLTAPVVARIRAIQPA